MASKTVLVMVGSFGSGCSYIARNILGAEGYEKISLSDYVRAEYEKINGDTPHCRKDLQVVGTNMRREKGPDYLARLACEEIGALKEDRVVIDSIRNPAEIHYFKNWYPRLTVMGVYAPPDTRWHRMRQRYDDDRRQFEQDDAIDRDERIAEGQRVTACFLEADYIVDNSTPIIDLKNSLPGKNLIEQVHRCLELIEDRGCHLPSDDEALMAVAYATGQRSMCMKRRVGAIIVDDLGHVLSSGYNDVPASLGREEPCKAKFNRCYRDQIRSKISEKIRAVIPEEETFSKVGLAIWEELKALDKCRALHAEERAIINVARSGVSIDSRCRMFVTTFPCNLCANKIAEIGLSEVVYFEPYPVVESVDILDKAGVKHFPFSGVTFNGYFRLLGGMPNANVP